MRSDIFRKVYLSSICLIAIAKAGVYFWWLSQTISYPFQLDYGEGTVLWQMQHVSRLSEAYGRITQYPYVAFIYPPLYHYTSWLLARLTGDLLSAGRLVSFLAAIGISVVLGLTAYFSIPHRMGQTARTVGAILAGALPCGCEPMQWARYARVDMLGMLLTCIGISIFLLARSDGRRYIAFAFFVAALFCRQTLIAAPLACLFVASLSNLRQAFKYLAFLAFVGALTMWWLQLATHGEAVRHLFLYNLNPFFVRRLIAWELMMIFVSLPLSVFAILAAGASWRKIARKIVARRRGSASSARTTLYRRALYVFSVYFVLSVLSSAMVGKLGAVWNYFLEWSISASGLAALALAGITWKWERGTDPRLAKAAWVVLLLLVLVPNPMTIKAWHAVVRNSEFHRQLDISTSSSQCALQILRDSPEPIMSEDLTLIY